MSQGVPAAVLKKVLRLKDLDDEKRYLGNRERHKVPSILADLQ